jgi:hypothetical protein
LVKPFKLVLLMIELPQSSCLWLISMEIFVFWKKNFRHKKKLFQIFFFAILFRVPWCYQKLFQGIRRFLKWTQLNLIKFLARIGTQNERKKNFCCWFLWEKFMSEDKFFQCRFAFRLAFWCVEEPRYSIWSQWPKKASFIRSSQFCDEYLVTLFVRLLYNFYP